MFFNHKRTALIVDSSPTILYYHGMLMKRMQYSVLTAPDPDEALRIMEHTVPNLLLTGITFAGARGIDFIRLIKSSPRFSGVPVVVLTSLEDSETRASCISAGSAACLSKPVEPACLFWTVQDVTERLPRQHVRIKTILKAIMGDEGSRRGPERHDYATTLSEGGLYLRTLSPRPKGDIVTVRIHVNDRVIKTKAVVLYQCSMGGGVFKEPGMGMKFVDIMDEDRDFLRKFIHEQLTSDIEINVLKRAAA
jgi:CheY-like chemotaxis protein